MKHLKRILGMAAATLTAGSLLASCSTPAAGVKHVTVAPALAKYAVAWDHVTKLNESEDQVSAKVASAIRAFSSESFTSLLKQKEQANLSFVPLSLYMDLAMLADSADGATKTDLEKALNQGQNITTEERQSAMKALMLAFNKEITEGDMKSQLSNSVWLRDPVTYKSSYADVLENVYQADSYTWSRGAEAETKTEMGKWIKEKTSGLLDENALPSDFPREDTLLAFMNALYYRASWGSPFEESQNTQGTFNQSDSAKFDVTFMNQTFSQSRALVRQDYQAADIVMADMSRMRFILPAEGVNGEDLVNSEEFYKDLFTLDAPDTGIVHWSVPKSEIDGKMDLLPLLDDLGLGALTSSMDLSAGLEGTGDVFLSDATQAVKIKMNEKGVEAAAVTVLGATTSAPLDPLEITMKLDRPFYMALLSPDGQVVFMSYVAQPNG